MSTPFRLRTALLALLLGTTLVPAGAAGLFDHPVSERALNAIRGGFSGADGGGLVVSFGLQRAVWVDGVAVATTTDAGALLLVQRGTGNAYTVGQAVSGAVGTVIQNSLDQQKLQAVTTLDVTANSVQAFRGLAWQASLRSSITDSLRH